MNNISSNNKALTSPKQNTPPQPSISDTSHQIAKASLKENFKYNQKKKRYLCSMK